MQNLHKEIGKRLKEVRNIYFRGEKLSARLFAKATGETRDNITNYENGRAGVPARLLVNLYQNGYNPIYILTGDGMMYAENEEGKKLLSESQLKNNVKPNVVNIYKSRSKAKKEKFDVIRAAAGKLK